MSTINAVTIFADDYTTANLITVGNESSNQSITANTTYLAIGSNVVINTTAISVGNSLVNTVVTSAGMTTNSITINGTTYTAIPSYANVLNYQVFTANGIWTKPAGTRPNDLITIMAWGGGGGGVTGKGGGGGACLIVNKLASECNAVCNVVVGSGGAVGLAGNNSIFWTNSTFSITAFAGGGGIGAGGGWFSAGGTNNGIGGSPLGGVTGTGPADSTFGGGGANNTVPGVSVYGGGGGSSISAGGSSIYGGAGGGNNGLLGSSIFGGAGGNSTVAATAPGGGGGANNTNGAGARGEVRIWLQHVG